MGKDKKLTTTAGCPVAHNQNADALKIPSSDVSA
jgi:hypothetical protein